MKIFRSYSSSALGLLSALALGAFNGAFAAPALLLDFGATPSTGAARLLDPAHAAGIVPAAEAEWNQIVADTASLVYSDGSAAVGVTLNLGRSFADGPEGNDIIDFNDDGYSVSALGTVLNSGIYAAGSPVRDGIFGGAGGTNNLALGMRVDGLPAGTYRIVVHGRNSNTAEIAGLRFYARTGASSDTYAFTLSDLNVVVANTRPAITAGFVEGDNFGVITITIGVGESLFVASEGDVGVEMRGFFNAIAIVPATGDLPIQFTLQPASRNVMQTATVTFQADGWASPDVSRQWLFEGLELVESPDVVGVHGNLLTLRNVTLANVGSYALRLSNASGSATSAAAVLSVVPVQNTEQMVNIWNILPGDRPYISTGNAERGLAFNELTTNLLVVCRTPSNQVVVLDALTGAYKHSLDLTGVADGTFAINHVGVAEDGVVYVANLTANATSPSYKIYRWDSDAPDVPGFAVFWGDPGDPVETNKRYGDNLAVRGAGADTQILIGTTTGSNVILLRTQSGNDFQTEIPPVVIQVSGAGNNLNAITLGLAFGPGENTFWAKTGNGPLYLIEFDADAGTGQVLHTYSDPQIPNSVRGIATDTAQKFLAGVALESPNDTVRLYDISDLASGPALSDQEAYWVKNDNGNGTAATAVGTNFVFALDSNNGLKAFALNRNYTPPEVAIVLNPSHQKMMEGATANFTAQASSAAPLNYQWRRDGIDLVNDGRISGADTDTLVIRNVTLADAGAYNLFVSNELGTATSYAGILTVSPTFNTAQMTNLWNLEPGSRSYLGAATATERGLAYNPISDSLLLVSRLPADPALVVLDAQTGAEKHFLDTAGIPGTVGGVSLGLNIVGVAADGAVYGGSVTVKPSTTPFDLYRWSDDTAAATRTLVFSGDPLAAVEPDLGWGDAMAVRGSGPDTQILVAPRAGTSVALLRTASGMDFQYEVPPLAITVTGVASAFGQWGLAFGPGTNTFWAKGPQTPTYLIQFDWETGQGTVLYSYLNPTPGNFRGINVSADQKFLAGLATDLSPNVQLYAVADLNAGPILRDQEVFATRNANITLGGVGTTAFGGNYLFALDTNNGLKAFHIDPNYQPQLGAFAITSIGASGQAVVLTWSSVANRTYQVQSRATLTEGWSNLGAPIIATGATTSFTNTISDSSRFYRVSGQ
ncbi:MAG: DUF4623 domain-containing protein [Verrucomicrobiae bacterium]|nr:DUF4623 domain-containing protein [Verrucomicrobiae bacterium]